MSRSRMHLGPHRSRGFTLIELMVVVVIVGVLATLAVVGYRKLVQSSHTTEATHMVESIRIAQEGYHAEAGGYADVSSNLTSDLCPVHSKGGIKVPWVSTCGGGATWAVLPVHPDGPVLFGYATKAGRAGASYPTVPNEISGSLTGNATGDWYMISAKGDSDNNGTYCVVVGYSWTNQLSVANDGE